MAITPKGAEREVSGMGKAVRPLIVVVFLAGGAFVGWTKYQERLPQKTVEDLFTYLDAKNYEKAYYQYSDKAHEKYGMTLDYFASIYKGTTKHEILSMTTMQGESLSTHPNQSEAFKKMAKDFSFQDYQNKKLFRVEFYTENPETDIQLYENLERYCSSPGIVVDAYFGVVQEATFTWKILFFHPLDSKCMGENKYAEYLQESREKEEMQRQTRRIQDIQYLINLCQSKLTFHEPIHDITPSEYYWGKGKEADALKEEIDRQRKIEKRAVENWPAQIQEYCTCSIRSVYSELTDGQIEEIKNDFWKIGSVVKGHNQSCDEPDLIDAAKYKYSNYTFDFW